MGWFIRGDVLRPYNLEPCLSEEIRVFITLSVYQNAMHWCGVKEANLLHIDYLFNK